MAIWMRTVEPQGFDFVSSRPELDEVNLWFAGGRRVLDGAETGDLVLFRVRGRVGIGGYALFFNDANYFADAAWDIFDQGNGAPTRAAFWTQVKARHTAQGLDLYPLGCHDLVEPVYISKVYRRLPEDALRRLSSGPIDEESPDGELLLAYLEGAKSAPFVGAWQDAPEPRDLAGRRRIAARRGGFRINVHKAYKCTCAITENTVLPSLEAVHFIADHLNGALIVPNATLLRRDLHPLLEQGYMTLSADYRVLFSNWLPKAYPQWETYRAFSRKRLTLPQDRSLWPDPELLARPAPSRSSRAASSGTSGTEFPHPSRPRPAPSCRSRGAKECPGRRERLHTASRGSTRPRRAAAASCRTRPA